MPSQLNSAGSEPFSSNEELKISNASPPEELLDEEEELLDEEDELLDEVEELLDEDEELLDEELLELELEVELLEEELLELPPQPAIAVASRATLHAKRDLFMLFPPIVVRPVIHKADPWQPHTCYFMHVCPAFMDVYAPLS